MRSRFAVNLIVPVTIVLAVLVSQAPASEVDFEGLSVNTSVNGQAGWTVEDEFSNSATAFDEEVVDDGTGNTVLRISNSVTSGGFSDQPYSHTSPQVAGESGSALWNDRGSDHTMPLSPPNPGATPTTAKFHTSFRFRSATGAAQSGMRIDISPSAKQSSWRNSFLRIDDDGANGLDVFFYNTDTTADPFGAGAPFPEVATDLGYAAWHTAELFIEFVDGLNGDTTGNDIVYVLINGALVYTGTTWESYYNGSNPASLNAPDQPHRQAIDSVVFSARGTAVPGNAGNGFYFDNVVVDNAMYGSSAVVPVPAAAWMGMLLMGGIAGAGAMRRRSQRA